MTTNPFFVAATTLAHENTAWAVFGHLSYAVTDALTVTGGARYTDDEKDLTVDVRADPLAAAESSPTIRSAGT